jgi:hypothetical protein
MAQELTWYRGNTFLANGVYTDANDDPIDLIAGGIDVISYILDRNNEKIDLNVTISGGIGEYQIDADTENWPLGRVTWVVRYIQGTVKKGAEPVIINVENS